MNCFKSLNLAIILIISGCNQPQFQVGVLKDLNGQNPALAGLYPAADCSGDNFEPNNTRDGAQWLSPDDVLELELCGNDDWYYLQVNQGDVVEATVEFMHRDGDLDLELFGEQTGNRVLGDSTSDNETVSLEAKESGRLYVRVYGYSGAENRYALKLAVTGSGHSSGCPTDGLEPNDYSNSARELQPGTYQGLTVCQNAPDYYSVYLNRGDTLQATAHNFSETDSVRFFIYGPEDGSGYSTQLTDREATMNLVAREPGLAFIQISVDHSYWNQDISNYKLTVAVFKPDHIECLDDPLEPNDQKAEALLMLENSWASLRSCPGNPDFFYKVLDPAETMQVFLQHDAGDDDLSLSVVHPDGAESLGQRTDGYQRAVSAQAALCGTRYLKVVNNTDTDIPYYLRVEVESPGSGATRLESMCGDQRYGFGCGTTTWAGPTKRGVGSRTYRILLKECSSCPTALRISARLLRPEGVYYDIWLTNEHGGYLVVDSHTDGQAEYLTWKTGGENTELKLRVLFEGYSDSQACLEDWVLDIRGGGSADDFSGFLP